MDPARVESVLVTKIDISGSRNGGALMKRRDQFSQRILGGLVLGVALLLTFEVRAVSASMIFDLTLGNTATIGSGPFAKVTVTDNAGDTATIKFERYGSYLMGAAQAVYLNTNGIASLVAGSISWTGGNAGTDFSSEGSGTADGFGTFNFRLKNFDGYNSAVQSVTFQISKSGGWFSDADVLALNGSNHLAAAHIFNPLNSTCGDNGTSVCTGFATDTAAAVPEPATLLLVGSGLMGIGWFGRKRLKDSKDPKV